MMCACMGHSNPPARVKPGCTVRVARTLRLACKRSKPFAWLVWAGGEAYHTLGVDGWLGSAHVGRWAVRARTACAGAACSSMQAPLS
jgi:hypothetical protein